MKQQKLEVIINTPSEEHLRDLLADAVTDIVVSRINKLPEEIRMKVYEDLVKEAKEREVKQ